MGNVRPTVHRGHPGGTLSGAETLPNDRPPVDATDAFMYYKASVNLLSLQN